MECMVIWYYVNPVILGVQLSNYTHPLYILFPAIVVVSIGVVLLLVSSIGSISSSSFSMFWAHLPPERAADEFASVLRFLEKPRGRKGGKSIGTHN